MAWVIGVRPLKKLIRLIQNIFRSNRMEYLLALDTVCCVSFAPANNVDATDIVWVPLTTVDVTFVECVAPVCEPPIVNARE